MQPNRNRAPRVNAGAQAGGDRQDSHHARAQAHLRKYAHPAQAADYCGIGIPRACGCNDHDESLCAFPQREETGRDERLGKAHPKRVGAGNVETEDRGYD